MGGYPNIDLSSHRRDDRYYNRKRRELKKYLPKLKQYLESVQNSGDVSSVNYSVLQEFNRQLQDSSVRVPMHVLLRGEDLLRREVLKHEEVKSSIVEAVWRSLGFRMAVNRKLQESVAKYGNCTDKDPANMEQLIFNRAKTKDEYLEYAARIILYLKDSHHKVRHQQRKADLLALKTGRRVSSYADWQKKSSQGRKRSASESDKSGAASRSNPSFRRVCPQQSVPSSQCHHQSIPYQDWGRFVCKGQHLARSNSSAQGSGSSPQPGPSRVRSPFVGCPKEPPTNAPMSEPSSSREVYSPAWETRPNSVNIRQILGCDPYNGGSSRTSSPAPSHSPPTASAPASSSRLEAANSDSIPLNLSTASTRKRHAAGDSHSPSRPSTSKSRRISEVASHG